MTYPAQSRLLMASGLCAVLFATVAHAQAPAPAKKASAAAASTNVSPVTVTAEKPRPGDHKTPPDTYAPKSATCELLVATDPFIRAQYEASLPSKEDVEAGLTPYAAGITPRIYLPTRPPLNPDYKAPPRSAPGSALPPAASTWSAISTARGNDIHTLTPNDGEVSTLTIANALNLCRSGQVRGDPFDVAGRTSIARRDTTLQTGLALFDHGRYAEALTYFERAYAKLDAAYGGDEAGLMAGKIMIFAFGAPNDVAKGVERLKTVAGLPFNPSVSMPVFDPDEPERNTAMGEAAMILARIYQKGFGPIAKDPAQSRKWFARAAAVGHVPAAKVLGDIYYLGAETPRDLDKAFKAYRQAARLGYAPAQYALGEMYLSGEYGGAPDLAKGLAWCNEAAKREHPEALFVMAQAFDTGEGLARDPQRALGLYKIAALRGSRAAKTSLGLYFYQGEILSRDPVIARKWFEQAAVEGDADAMFNLGVMMMKGEGGAADRTRAWVWLKIAQAGEHPGASAAVTRLEAEMTSQEKATAARLLTPPRAA